MTRGPKSSLKQLPPAILAQVNFMLTEGAWKIEDIVKYLAEAGHPRSKSSVGRYKKGFDEVAAALRESREVTEALVREIGPAASDGKQGRLLVEILRKLVFDHLMGQVSGDATEAMGTEDFFFLAKAMKEMSAATRYDQDFELKVRQEIEKKAKQEAAQAAESAAREGGASDEQVAFIRARILGIQDRVEHGDG